METLGEEAETGEEPTKRRLRLKKIKDNTGSQRIVIQLYSKADVIFKGYLRISKVYPWFLKASIILGKALTVAK